MQSLDEDTTLFIYGSLLDQRHRETILGRRFRCLTATVQGYRRERIRYYYLRQHPNAETEGQLLLNLTPDDFRVLDRYEEVPVLYTREKLSVTAASGEAIRCWAYMPTARMLG